MQAAPAEEEKTVQETVEEKGDVGISDMEGSGNDIDLVEDDEEDDVWDMEDGDNEEDDMDMEENAEVGDRKKRSIYRKPHKKYSYGYKRYWPVHKKKYVWYKPYQYKYGYKPYYPYGKYGYNQYHKKPYYWKRPYGKHHGYRKW